MELKKISVVLHVPSDLPNNITDFEKMLDSLKNQNYAHFRVILFGNSDFGKEIAKKYGFQFVHTLFTSKSKALNVAFKKATGDYVLYCNNEFNIIEFKRSALLFYNMVMNRHRFCSLLYTDYDFIDNGIKNERKLLEFHEGRIRESWDMGYCILFRRRFLETVGFLDERYQYNPIYDLCLKAFNAGEIVHCSNRFNGVPYHVYKESETLDVFAYLKAGKDIALELETICTEHLKRIGAYLSPNQFYQTVFYEPEEELAFKECIASVVVPVFGRPEFIGPAIDSIQNQTIKNIEAVIVCNGGEQDPTVAEVKRYLPEGDKYDPQKPKVRLIVHDMNNIGLCLNHALQTSTAKYYIQLDSDDLLFENAVEKILEVYDKDDKIGMVIGTYQVFEKERDGTIVPVMVDNQPFIVTHDEWTEENGRNNLLRIGGAGAPRSIKIKVLQDIGWFGMNDSPYSRNYGEDYELVNKVAEHYKIGRLWEPIYKVVRHPGGTDHMINQQTIDVNDNAKDAMRLEAIRRRQSMNAVNKSAEN